MIELALAVSLNGVIFLITASFCTFEYYFFQMLVGFMELASESIGKKFNTSYEIQDTKMFLCRCQNNDCCIVTNYMESIFQRKN